MALRGSEYQRLRQVYGFRCGYCGVSETNVGAELTQDHFHPRSQGGAEDFENIVYACHACNEYKKDYWNPNDIERILHPLNDDIAAHLTENPDGTLTGKTLTGVFHIQRLRLNRPGLVANRQERIMLQGNRILLLQVAERIESLNNLVQDLLSRVPPRS